MYWARSHETASGESIVERRNAARVKKGKGNKSTRERNPKLLSKEKLKLKKKNRKIEMVIINSVTDPTLKFLMY